MSPQQEELVAAYNECTQSDNSLTVGLSLCGALLGSVYGLFSSILGGLTGYCLGITVDKSLRKRSTLRLKYAIQAASQYLSHLEYNPEENYDKWLELKTVLDPIEDFYCGRPAPNDSELMDRFLYTLNWCGLNHFRVRAFFDQYKERVNFIRLARIALNTKQARITNPQ